MKNGNILRTPKEFGSWLSRHGSFHDCRVVRLDPHPGDETAPPPTGAILELAYQVEGNYKAHSRSVSRHFRFSLSGIRQYSLPADHQHHPGHCSEGVEILEDCGTIGFQIDVPALLTVQCDSILVQELPHLVETVKPWLSERDIHVKVPGAGLPTPHRWVEWFELQGQAVAWHIYGGEPTPSTGVPPADYQGWFLQIPKDIDETHQGLFFFSCKTEASGFSVQIENHGASYGLWQATKRILGQFDHGVVHCGNCEFTSQKWLEEVGKQRQAQEAGSDAGKPRTSP